MLSNELIRMIEDKYGKTGLLSSDCAALAASMGLGETTVKRMLGLVGEHSAERFRVPRKSTYDILARWLGYNDYKSLFLAVNQGNISSEFIDTAAVEACDLIPGTRIQLRYEPDRMINLTFLGGEEFVINHSKNSKLIKDDHLFLSHLVPGLPIIIKNVVREGENLGGYIGAKNGGLTLLNIISPEKSE